MGFVFKLQVKYTCTSIVSTRMQIIQITVSLDPMITMSSFGLLVQHE